MMRRKASLFSPQNRKKKRRRNKSISRSSRIPTQLTLSFTYHLLGRSAISNDDWGLQGECNKIRKKGGEEMSLPVLRTRRREHRGIAGEQRAPPPTPPPPATEKGRRLVSLLEEPTLTRYKPAVEPCAGAFAITICRTKHRFHPVEFDPTIPSFTSYGAINFQASYLYYQTIFLFLKH